MMSKNLVVYYSRKGQNYWNGEIRNLEKGNTEIVAEMIQKETGADLLEVETLQEYPTDYTECTKVAMAELKAKARPLLKTYPAGIEDYEVIFVGYPNWWGTMPMAMFSFLEHYNLAGKTIVPFCTNEGSGMGTSEKDLKKLLFDSKVLPGLAIHGAEATESAAKVSAFVADVLNAK